MVMILLLVIVVAFTSQIASQVSVPAAANTIPLAYVYGIVLGVLGALVVGLVGGSIVQRLITQYQSGRIVHEATYKAFVNSTKYIVAVFIVLTVPYAAWTYYTGGSVQAEVIISTLVASVAIVTLYDQLLRRQNKAENE